MENSSLPAVEMVVKTMAETVVANEAYFSQLDAVVADGDFGYSLARGFSAVLADFDQFDRASTGTFLKKVALVISSKVGGASGPLWGTAFLRAAAAAGDRQTLASGDVIAMLRAAAGGIQQRGGAVLGDKTLLDALIPATDALEAALSQPGATGDHSVGALQRTAEAARRAAEATASMMAKKGRAAYTGERSIGSVDAGAVAIAVIAEGISAAWRERYGTGKEPA
jgi:phosphoenolpyruvate---glycerone phosphotransferase subunit DhaL